MDKKGLLLCAKYAISPNFFGFCGPRKSMSIIDHLKDKVADRELLTILSDFETLFPYLQLIAKKNQIDNPFNKQVVEAYWLGNELLKNISNKDCWYLFEEKLLMSRKIDKNKLFKIRHKMSKLHFLPHHNFHVFNIFKRTGYDCSIQTLQTMDDCRINYGQIQKSKFKINQTVIVQTNQLTIQNQQLRMHKLINREIAIDYRGKIFLKDLKPGDWVSFHWGRVCDVLTVFQVNNLQYYTKRAVDYYNT